MKKRKFEGTNKSSTESLTSLKNGKIERCER